MSSTIKSLRLISGEEIVAEINQSYETPVTFISRPFVLQLMHTGNGKIEMVLVPWFNSNPEAANISIENSHIIAKIDPMKEVISSYIQQTTGIEVASGYSY